MWQSVRDPIDTIRSEREAVARENDEREKRNEEMEIEDIPFDDMAYDCEDSAAGGLYLEDDTDEEGDDL
jgi:hypothetical protein